MSTTAWIAGFIDIEAEEVSHWFDVIEKQLREDGLIVGDNNPELALEEESDRAFASGLVAFANLQDPMFGLPVTDTDPKSEIDWNRVLFRGPNYFNTAPWIDGPDFKCPVCKTTIQSEDDNYDTLYNETAAVVDAFRQGSMNKMLSCPCCDASSDINYWLTNGDFFVSHLAIEFCQWTDDAFAAARNSVQTAMPNFEIRQSLYRI